MISKKSTTKKEDVLIKEATSSIFDNRKYVYAIGRRKRATAQVRYYENGKGEIIVNNQDFKKYFPFFIWQKNIIDPLEKTNKINKVDISVLVKGGGKSGQSESIRHGIARILVKVDPETKLILKKYGFLTRDSREKERKKPGLKKARKAPQWAKR
ncbi:30S ribosomal protein S9 [Candidatus Kuenenbacteria bacterium]|nr:30S ribosomal protein S9 [Candidatus Kuenenbacteria bacterium]